MARHSAASHGRAAASEHGRQGQEVGARQNGRDGDHGQGRDDAWGMRSNHDDRGDHQDRGGNQQHDRSDFRSLNQELRAADQIFFGDFVPLNSSGVSAKAIVTVDFGKPNTLDDDLLTVRIIANGVTPGEEHLQHVHGFGDGVTQSTTPTIKDDADADGFVELAEGRVQYGPILLDLEDPATGLYPIADAKGSYYFEQTYHLLGSNPPHGNHDSQAISSFADLQLNHLVIHGLNVNPLSGQGTPGEVGNDPDLYKEVLPVAVAQLEEVSFRDARHQVRDLADDGFFFG